MKEKLYSRIDEIGVVGPAWEKLKEVLKEIVDELPKGDSHVGSQTAQKKTQKK